MDLTYVGVEKTQNTRLFSLVRPEQLAASGLNRAEVKRILDDPVAIPVTLAFRWRPSLPDPDDDMVLETAVNGSADAIVTFNRRHKA